MVLLRRQFLRLAAGGATAAFIADKALSAERTIVRAIAFDALAIFNLGPIFVAVEQLFPGRGAKLSAAWRTRQFEYCWLRSLSGRYADFWTVTEDALVFAAKTLRIDLTDDKRRQIMNGYLSLQPYPDVGPALAALRDAGIRLGFLSNFSPMMLQTGIKTAGLNGLFEQILSTDRVRAYKPDPRAYLMGVEAFGLRPDEIVFAAFAGWDAAGARSGYPTFWVNRLGLPAEELGVTADASGAMLADLVAFARRNA